MKKFPKLNLSGAKKFVPKSRRALIVAAAILLFAAGIGATIALLTSDSSQNKDKEITQNLQSLNKEQADCKQIIDKIGSLSADQAKSYESKVELLKKQSECFAESYQFDNAISATNQLKELYNSKGDNDNAARMEKRTKDLESVKAQRATQPEVPKKTRQQKLDEAIEIGKKIREDYKSKNNTAGIGAIDQRIKQLEDAKSNPDKEPEFRDD